VPGQGEGERGGNVEDCQGYVTCCSEGLGQDFNVVRL
jgi:hypothetical protein